MDSVLIKGNTLYIDYDIADGVMVPHTDVSTPSSTIILKLDNETANYILDQIPFENSDEPASITFGKWAYTIAQDILSDLYSSLHLYNMKDDLEFLGL